MASGPCFYGCELSREWTMAWLSLENASGRAYLIQFHCAGALEFWPLFEMVSMISEVIIIVTAACHVLSDLKSWQELDIGRPMMFPDIKTLCT